MIKLQVGKNGTQAVKTFLLQRKKELRQGKTEEDNSEKPNKSHDGSGKGLTTSKNWLPFVMNCNNGF